MEDNFNTGGTHYQDADGKEISQEEYLKLTIPADGASDVPAPDKKEGGKKQ